MSSRWLETPEHVTEQPGDLPAGFRAAGVAVRAQAVAAGSTSGCWSPTRRRRVSAARFTRSGVLAAPVRAHARSAARLDALRVVVANSGNANAATGRRGLRGRGAHAGRRRDGRRRAPRTRSRSPRPA